MEKIKVFLVEDDPDWVITMTYLLNSQKGIEVKVTASNREEALSKAFVEKYDVVLMDINLSENKYDGIFTAADILSKKKVKIIMLTSLDSDDIIVDSFKAGAIDYVLKSNFKSIPHIIRSAYTRRLPIEVLLEDYYRLSHEEILKDLTPSEREVFELKKQGLTTKEIAEKLNKTERTLKNQSGVILKKLSVRNFKDAIDKVLQKGRRFLK